MFSDPQTKYKHTAEMDRASYTSVIDTPDILHAQQMKNIISQVGLSKFNEDIYKVTETLQLHHLFLVCVFVRQKKYKEEAEKTMSHYVPVLDTPEMMRVRENQKNFSTVSRTIDLLSSQRGVQVSPGGSPGGSPEGSPRGSSLCLSPWLLQSIISNPLNLYMLFS